MQSSVENGFFQLVAPQEGVLSKGYLDEAGAFTTAIGYLADSAAETLALPWLSDATGTLAGRDEVLASFAAVKARTDMVEGGGVAFTKLPGNTVHLSDASIHALTMQRLNAFENSIRAALPDYDTWPAPAQLGTLAMVWGLGPRRLLTEFPRWRAAVEAQDFFTAANESHISNGRAERNALNKQLFMNGGKVIAANLPHNVLYYPDVDNVLDEVVVTGSPFRVGTVVAFVLMAGATYWFTRHS